MSPPRPPPRRTRHDEITLDDALLAPSRNSSPAHSTAPSGGSASRSSPASSTSANATTRALFTPAIPMPDRSQASSSDSTRAPSVTSGSVPYGSFQYYTDENDIDLSTLGGTSTKLFPQVSASHASAMGVFPSMASHGLAMAPIGSRLAPPLSQNSLPFPPRTAASQHQQIDRSLASSASTVVPLTIQQQQQQQQQQGALPPSSFAVDQETGLARTPTRLRRRTTLSRPERQRSTRRLMSQKPSDRFGEWYTKDILNRSGADSFSGKSSEGGLLKRTNTTWRSKFSTRDSDKDEIKLTWWVILSRALTVCIPKCALTSCKMRDPQIQQAWREKVALCIIIGSMMAFVGFFTFGFQDVVCDYSTNTIQYAKVVGVTNTSYVAIRGKAYDAWTLERAFNQSHASVGSFTALNMLGKDLTPMFPPVGGICATLLGSASLPFNCSVDGIADAHCHTELESGSSGTPVTGLKFQGTLFRKFSDLPKNMVAFNGKVLDISKWTVGQDFLGMDFYNDVMKSVGKDITYVVSQTPGYKERAECLSDVFAISQVESSSFGCVLSQIFIYISFVMIMGLVGAKFFFALFFHFAIGWRLGERESGSMVARDLARRHAEEENHEIMRRNTVTAARRGSLTNSPSNETLHPDSALNPEDASYNNNGLQQPGALHRTYTRNIAASRYTDLELSAPYTHRDPSLNDPNLMHTMVMMPCYSEGMESLRSTLDSIALTYYPATHKCIVAVADGIIKGSGEEKYTWEYLVDMMDIDDRFADEDPRRGGKPPSYSYVSIADGNKRKNYADVYVGWYKFMDEKAPENDKKNANDQSQRNSNGELKRMRSMAGTIRKRKRGRVPMITIVKVGNDEEQASGIKSGNRGKRDSQAMLMQFLTKVMFDDRMTELEFDLFHKFWTITGLHPGSYEAVLMVDADTRVYPDSLTHLVACMKRDPTVMGVCGETQVYNKWQSWVTMIQVYEYYISHHLVKAFESVFGGVTCLPGCFCMYRIKAPKGDGEWVPILANPDIVEDYSENVVDTLHKKNLLLLGEDRYLTTLMLRTFPRRNNIFVPQAICKTVIPDSLWVLISQRRRWINSTIHNLLELSLVRDLCGTFCFSMQFIIMLELCGSVVLPAATFFTIYMVVNTFTSSDPQILPLILLAAILLLPTLVSVLTIRRFVYFFWFLVYLVALAGWQVVLPLYAFWHFDDFTWGDTRKVTGDDGKDHSRRDGEFDHSGINMKRWSEWVRFKAHECASFSEGMLNAADTSSSFLGPVKI